MLPSVNRNLGSYGSSMWFEELEKKKES